jgi:predicted nucleotide-binding protein
LVPSVADQLRDLLVQHLQQSVPVLKAAKSGDQAALDKAVADWRLNASAIATLLSQNLYLPYQDANAMMQKHLDTTIAEASARLKADWAADAQAYNAVRAHIVMLSDTISNAIAATQPLKLY